MQQGIEWARDDALQCLRKASDINVNAGIIWVKSRRKLTEKEDDAVTYLVQEHGFDYHNHSASI